MYLNARNCQNDPPETEKKACAALQQAAGAPGQNLGMKPLYLFVVAYKNLAAVDGITIKDDRRE